MNGLTQGPEDGVAGGRRVQGWRAAGLVAAGGALGTGARALIDLALAPDTYGDWPWGVLTVNLVGCLALGWLTGALGAGRWSRWGEVVRLLAGTGFLGAFTTYSALGVGVVLLGGQGLGGPGGPVHPGGLGVVYALVSVGAGVVLAGVGLGIGGKKLRQASP